MMELTKDEMLWRYESLMDYITNEIDENGMLRNVVFTGGCHGNLQGISRLVDGMKAEERAQYGAAAKARIKSAYSWEFIGSEYRNLWLK